jgi:REase_DpnII-MboI
MKTNWTKATALAELRTLADGAQQLATTAGAITIESPICEQCGGHGDLPLSGGRGRRCPACDGRGRIPNTSAAFSAEHTRWAATCLAVLEEVFGQDSRYYLSFDALRWVETGSFIIPGGAGTWRNPQAAVDRRHHQAYLRDLETARGLLLAAADHLARSDLASVYEGKNTAPESSAIIKVINLAGTKLRTIIRSTPSNEKGVQDAFEGLLVGADLPYSREADRIEYSSKSYVPDFTMPQLDLAIEVKLCKESDREKAIIGEINDDILAYQTKYGNILFIVYDVGQIRDVERFTASFELHQNVVVRVVKE